MDRKMEILNPRKEYTTCENLVYSCQYHVIFCSKYRKPIITGEIEVRLREILYNVASQYNFEIIEVEMMPDYVHMIISCNPQFGIAECVKKMKSASAHILRKEFKKLTTSMPNLWTRHAFISTVGSVSLDVINKYVASQKGV